MLQIPKRHAIMNSRTDRPTDLSSIDLNLLTAFSALMSERHVGRAADRLSLTQSGMSKRLARLRAMFNDKMFVRVGDGVAPTPKALEISEPLGDGLRLIESVITAQRRFDPMRVERVFRFAANDLFASVFAPELLVVLSRTAPGIRLSIQQMTRSGMVDALELGDVDFAVTVLPDPPGSLRRAELAADAFVCLVAEDHPRIRDALTLEDLVRERHLLVSLAGDFHGVVDRLLEERGLRRTIAASQPYHLAAPIIVAETDLIVTVPRSIAARLPWPGVRVFPLPLPHPGFRDVLYWHRRNDRDPACVWMRKMLSEVVMVNG
jgi:LysR family transcriptional regulator, mexEF-oprN operon transcriptional activator